MRVKNRILIFTRVCFLIISGAARLIHLLKIDEHFLYKIFISFVAVHNEQIFEFWKSIS